MNCGLVTANTSHTLSVVASGSSIVSLAVYLDGIYTGSVIDSSDTYTVARPGFALIGDGTPADAEAGAWQDYRGNVAVPVISPHGNWFECRLLLWKRHLLRYVQWGCGDRSTHLQSSVGSVPREMAWCISRDRALYKLRVPATRTTTMVLHNRISQESLSLLQARRIITDARHVSGQAPESGDTVLVSVRRQMEFTRGVL